MTTSLKNKATHGMLWAAIEKLSMQAGQFIIGIILARLLMPKDFGLIGMLSIFIAIGQVFIDSGMGRGLIQKKDRTDIDFSTVFIFNFVVSITVYLILFFSAPLIAEFYNTPALINLTRILTLNIVISSLAIIQQTKLTIDLDFKTLAKVNVATVFIGGITGVVFALLGFGVWALVIQQLTSRVVAVLLFWYLTHWQPSLVFSKKSFKELFRFGSKLLIAGVSAQFFLNIYNIIIGRVYSPANLGHFTQSRKLVDLSSGTVTDVLNKVSFPILASLKDDSKKMISVYSRLIRMTAFIIFPVMTLVSLLADPIIRVLLNDKWLPVIPLLQVMAFTRIFYPISALNMNILTANGRSDLFLKVDISKVPIVVISLLITVPMGINAIVIGFVITSIIAFFINAYMPGKLFGYGIKEQIKDMFPFFITTIIMAITVYFSVTAIDNSYLKLFIGSIVGIVSYLLVNYLFKTSELNEIKLLLTKIR